jgi:hypothetical protein
MKVKKNIAISESGYIFNPSTGESFTVNPIGIEIFNMIKSDKSFEEVSKFILERYNADESTIEKDYNDFVGMLKMHQLIENEDKE